MTALLVFAILLFQDAGMAHPATPNPATLPVGRNCEWISASHSELVPVAQACEAANQMWDSMPNFVCDLKVKRKQVVPARAGGSTKFSIRKDTVTAEVRYVNGKEEFANLSVDDKPVHDPKDAQTSNWTSGEFSPPAILVLAFPSAATFTFHNEEVVAHASHLDFDYVVPQENSSWRWNFFDRWYNPAFHGSMSIDKRTGFVRSFTMIADQLPADVPYLRVQISTDYDSVMIPGLGIYQLPVRSAITTCQRGFPDCDQNIKEFSGCRRFAAKARIIP